MKDVLLDASAWRSGLDVLEAIRQGLQAPDWHGMSYAAFYDSMVMGDINALAPPYRIVIWNIEAAGAGARLMAREFAGWIEDWFGPASDKVRVEFLPRAVPAC